MNRIELEAAIAERTNVNKKVVTEILQAFMDISTETLAHGEAVRLTGFGTLTVKERAARKGKNPKTGESIDIPASRKVSLSAGKSLIAAVNLQE